MSFTEIRPYFRARLKTVAPELQEWKATPDTTATKNVPNTVISNRYSIEIGVFSEARHDMECLTLEGPARVKLWLQKGQEPQKAIDSIIAKGEALIKEALRPSHRVTQPGIKNVVLNTFDPAGFDVSNDNLIELLIEFNLTIILDIPQGV